MASFLPAITPDMSSQTSSPRAHDLQPSVVSSPHSILKNRADPLRPNPIPLLSASRPPQRGGASVPAPFARFRPRKVTSGWSTTAERASPAERRGGDASLRGDASTRSQSSNNNNNNIAMLSSMMSVRRGSRTFDMVTEWTAETIASSIYDTAHREVLEATVLSHLEQMIPLASAQLSPMLSSESPLLTSLLDASQSAHPGSRALRKVLPALKRKVMTASGGGGGLDIMSRLAPEYLVNGQVLHEYARQNLDILLVRALCSLQESQHLRVIVFVHIHMTPQRMAVLAQRGLGTSFGAAVPVHLLARVDSDDIMTSMTMTSTADASTVSSLTSPSKGLPVQRQQNKKKREDGTEIGDQASGAQQQQEVESAQLQSQIRKNRLLGIGYEGTAKIRALCLSFCDVEDAAVEILCENLCFSPTSSLTSLDLSHNRLSDRALPLLLRCCQRTSGARIAHLNLRGNSRLFAAATSSPPASPTRGGGTVVNGFLVLPMTVLRFLTIANSSTALETLELSLCGITADQMAVAVPSIAGFNNFISLSFDGVDMNARTAALLLESLKNHNTRLLHLSLRFIACCTQMFNAQLALVLARNLELRTDQDVLQPLQAKYGADMPPPRAVMKLAQQVYLSMQPLFATGTPQVLSDRIRNSSLQLALAGEVSESCFVMRETSAGLRSVLKTTNNLAASVLAASARRERQQQMQLSPSLSQMDDDGAESPSQRIARLLDRADGGSDSDVLDSINMNVARQLYIRSALPPGYAPYQSNQPSRHFSRVAENLANTLSRAAAARANDIGGAQDGPRSSSEQQHDIIMEQEAVALTEAVMARMQQQSSGVAAQIAADVASTMSASSSTASTATWSAMSGDRDANE